MKIPAPLEPVKKTYTRRKKEERNPKNLIIAKAIFLAFLILAVLIFQYFASHAPKKTALSAPIEKPAVLGSAVQLASEKTFSQIAAAAKTQADKVKQILETEAGQIFEQKTDELHSSVSGVLYQTTLKPLMQRFDQLDPREQQEVRAVLCK